MPVGLIGKKCGMTRVFTEDGISIPVTVIEVLPNRVTQIKNLETDGYRAVQVTIGKQAPSRLNKALAGHFAKANVEAGTELCEFRLNDGEDDAIAVGNELKVDIFKVGQIVDVSGTSRGKGFAGTIKRHHFNAQDASHGNSLSHRAPGSIGQRQTPGRVFPGKRMSGHMGNKNRTVINQEIVKIDPARNLLFVSGGVPGAPNGLVRVMPSSRVKAVNITRGE